MRVPHTEQKWLDIVLPVSMVLDCENLVNLDSPRTCRTEEVATMKLEANIDAVILRQSVAVAYKCID